MAAEYRRAARAQDAARRISASRLLDADDITRLEERIDAQRQARELCARIRRKRPTSPLCRWILLTRSDGGLALVRLSLGKLTEAREDMLAVLPASPRRMYLETFASEIERLGHTRDLADIYRMIHVALSHTA